MDQKKQSLHEQILKLLEGRSTSQEAEEFLQLPPEILDAFLDEQEWNELSPGALPEEWSASWLESINRRKATRVRRMSRIYWSSAAAVLLLGVATFMYLLKEQVPGQKLSASNATYAGSKPKRDTVIQNLGNKKQRYSLPDRSVVELSPGSTLRYDATMQESRTLWLEGEGVFDVVHDSNRPFTVYTRDLITTDLGTVFRITAYKNKRTAQVQLISGEVMVQSLRDTSRAVYLTAGQSCRFELSDLSLQLVPQVKDRLLPKAEKKEDKTLSEESLDFHNTPLPDVLQRIGSTYHAHFEFSKDSLMSRKFTGSFNKNAKLDDIIRSLLLVNELTSNKVGDTIYISTK